MQPFYIFEHCVRYYACVVHRVLAPLVLCCFHTEAYLGPLTSVPCATDSSIGLPEFYITFRQTRHVKFRKPNCGCAAPARELQMEFRCQGLTACLSMRPDYDMPLSCLCGSNATYARGTKNAAYYAGVCNTQSVQK